MSDAATARARSPLGFVVEGHGEYEAFPSFVGKIWGFVPGLIPRTNPRGYGSIVKHLELHLDDLVKLYHPITIIICLDVEDVLKAGSYASCIKLIEDFEERTRKWKIDRGSKPKFVPLPDRISTVVQVSKFETWMIADRVGLLEHEAFADHVPEGAWTNADNECRDPVAWITENTDGSFNSKVPRHVRDLVAKLDTARMANGSRSFRKYVKEVASANPYRPVADDASVAPM